MELLTAVDPARTPRPPYLMQLFQAAQPTEGSGGLSVGLSKLESPGPFCLGGAARL